MFVSKKTDDLIGRIWPEIGKEQQLCVAQSKHKNEII